MKSKIAILPEPIGTFLRPDFGLRSGLRHGVNGEPDVCLLQAVSWLTGGDSASDSPEGVCPVIRAYSMALNDADSSVPIGAGLKILAERIVGTASAGFRARKSSRTDRAGPFCAGTITDLIARVWPR